MFDVNRFLVEANKALSEQTVDALGGFIEKWVPVVSNTVSALQQENKMLELELTEAREE